MVSPYAKDILREIRRTPGRFFSLFLITMLGVAIFVGVQYTPSDMRHTGELFYRDQHLQDFYLLSNYGFDEKNIEALRALEGVSVFPSYARDVYVHSEDRGYVAHAMSLAPESEREVNLPLLVSGRMPERADECLVDIDFYSTMGADFGNRLTLSGAADEDLSKSLSVTEFTIVGIAQDPRYISEERGTSALGSGRVSFYLLLPQEAFAYEAYTELNVRLGDSATLNPFSDAYKTLISDTQHVLEETGKLEAARRYEDLRSDAEDELAKARETLNDGIRERDEKLADALQKITDAETELSDGRREWQEGVETLERETAEAQRKLDDGYAELESNQSRLNQNRKDVESGLAQLAEARQTLDESLAILEQGKAELDTLKTSAEALRAQADSLPDDFPEKLALAAQADAMLTAWSEQSALWSVGWVQYEEGLARWNAENETLQQATTALADGQRKLDAALKELIIGKAELQTALEDGQRELADAAQKLLDGEAELAQAREDYETGKAESATELEDAEAEILKAEADIADMPEPKWYVLDRDMLPGFAGYEDDTGNVQAIAAVFPLIFFLVAALVGLTSMTRMVEEHRTQMGIYKALGYGTTAIEWKSVSYALSASLSGSLAGVALGRWLLPYFISRAYGILYNLPPLSWSSNAVFGIIAVTAGVGSIVGATLIACVRETRSSAAGLLRPKPPAKGKRIFMERVGILWKRMSFISKVTARNLFRYKKRFLMTILGIAGCTALLVTGFGLRDSILDIAVKQFGELSRYDLQINFDPNASEKAHDELFSYLEQHLEKTLVVSIQNMEADVEGRPADVYLTVANDPAAVREFLVLRSRQTQKDTVWDDSGVLISEKLGYMTGLKPGDMLTLTNDRHEEFQLPVSGIVEHYVHHYVFITDTLYRDIFGEEAEKNNVYACLPDAEEEQVQEALSEELMRFDAVRGLNFTTKTRKTVNNMIQAMNFVVYVLLLSAAALAFIVLLNLTNINIAERVRELATIKVLGFTGGELAMYIFRENLWLTLFGALAGLVGGFFLHRYVILTAEVDLVMFGREIHAISYGGSIALTFVFALLVNAVMYPRLSRINMIESLKSVE